MSEAVEPAAARERLVEQLVASGHLERGSRVASSLRAVPRHVFVPTVAADEAYRDAAIPIKLDQDARAVSSSSQPAMMAIMLEQLDVRPGQRVLEIGAGTGYNAALLAHLVGERGEVVSVDIDPDLVEAARRHLHAACTSAAPAAAAASVSARVSVVCADGALALPDGGQRFDRVIVTAAARDVAPAWSDQLLPGGRMVLPLSLRGAQRCLALEHADGALRSVSVRDCAFMPLRGTSAGPEAMTEIEAGTGLFLHSHRELPADPSTIRSWLDDHAEDHTRPAEIPLGAAEALVGFGLWLAIADPDTVRLLAPGAPDHDLIRRFLPLPEHPAAVALLTRRGLAVLTSPGASSPAAASPHPAARGVGPDGPELAVRLLGHLRDWHVAGRPATDDLELQVHPPATPLTEGTSTIDTAHRRLAVYWH